MLGRCYEQYTKAERETLDVMCGESPKKTYCLVYGESLSICNWFCYKMDCLVKKSISCFNQLVK